MAHKHTYRVGKRKILKISITVLIVEIDKLTMGILEM